LNDFLSKKFEKIEGKREEEWLSWRDFEGV